MYRKQHKFNFKRNKFKLVYLSSFMIEQNNPLGDGIYSNNPLIKLRNLEEKQRMLKERLLLVGENLIDMREKNREEILGMKRDFEMMKRSVGRLVDFLEIASGEFSKFAKKEDLEILKKQAKMFQPLEFVRKKDLKNR